MTSVNYPEGLDELVRITADRSSFNTDTTYTELTSFSNLLIEVLAEHGVVLIDTRKDKALAWHHKEEGLSYENHYAGNIPLYPIPS